MYRYRFLADGAEERKLAMHAMPGPGSRMVMVMVMAAYIHIIYK